jgi:hypothetical protein
MIIVRDSLIQKDKKMNKYKYILKLILIVGLLNGIMINILNAAQQYQGLCARVKIEILQELTLERIGFLATLEITNNEGDAPITNFSARLSFENPLLSSSDIQNDASSYFFVRQPDLTGINTIDGDGIIPPGQTAIVEWFIIPTIEAGGETPAGVEYEVGATLAGAIYGQEIASEVLEVIPDRIVVRPEPQLDITYFQPRDVHGDDPFTPEIVESPIPFIVGVLVRNVGFGTARSVMIESQQPKIVENKEGLLLIARLLGARVDDAPLDEASLTVNLGDIEPSKCRKGAWDMITSLSGEFIEFNASYTHASDLGGEATSVITNMNAYFIAHEVLDDQPGRDDLLDFLADTDNDAEQLPDTLFESDCSVMPVNTLYQVTAIGNSSAASINVDADREGWVYMRLTDPAQSKLDIDAVVRSDGKRLNEHNYWTDVRYKKVTNERIPRLHLFDLLDTGHYQYQVTYAQSQEDHTAPTTTIRFSGASQQINETYYILPETQIYFTVDDDSPSGTFFKLDDAQTFKPAYPFQIQESGAHQLSFYSQDASGNREYTQNVLISILDNTSTIQTFDISNQSMLMSNDAISMAPSTIDIQFQVAPQAISSQATLEIFKGIQGWVQVSGVPASPTSITSAELQIIGDLADFYQYQVNDGQWSDDIPIAEPIHLTHLSEGEIHVRVRGRNAHGDYVSEDQSVHVFWRIDAQAHSICIGNTPATPSRTNHALLYVSGAELYRYSYTSEESSYYRPETNIEEPIQLEHLLPGVQVVQVIGKIGNTWQSQESPTQVQWQIDPAYGFDCNPLEKVRQINWEDAEGKTLSFQWDGKNDAGKDLPSGYYTARLTVTDNLGQSSYAIKMIHLDEMMTKSRHVDQRETIQTRLSVSKHWAVWQDQRNDNWDIFAKNLNDTDMNAITITNNRLNQEYPNTDGTWVVWEDYQANGLRDILMAPLSNPEQVRYITRTTERDEARPSIDWPWIVYQIQSNGVWQIAAYNLMNDQEIIVDSTQSDQKDPCVSNGRIVWQDFRDPGYGEIYLKDILLNQVMRITNDPDSQYHPVISNKWIAWEDTRNGQKDFYARHLDQAQVIHLTDTPYDESQPSINGDWVIGTDNSFGPLITNIFMIHLPDSAFVRLTHTDSEKHRPHITGNDLVWEDMQGLEYPRIYHARLPIFQAVYPNNNAVLITYDMAQAQKHAFGLLELWNNKAGITEITTYLSLVPTIKAQTAKWHNGQLEGDNFSLAANSFVWVKFDQSFILNLGNDNCNPITLYPGPNMISYGCFPDQFSSYQLIDMLGRSGVKSVRMPVASTGRWEVSIVKEGQIGGPDFSIPGTAVLLIDVLEQIEIFRE